MELLPLHNGASYRFFASNSVNNDYTAVLENHLPWWKLALSDCCYFFFILSPRCVMLIDDAYRSNQ